MKRYSLTPVSRCGAIVDELQEVELGEFVRWEDFEREFNTPATVERERLQRVVWTELEKLSDAALQSWIDRGFKTVSGLARALLELRRSEEPTR